MAISSTQRQDVIRAAAEVFWRSGYADAKIEDVVRQTSLNRYALYSAFGGKRELFLEVLDSYHSKGKGIFLEGLNDERVPPLEAVRRVCAWAIGEMAARGAGCLIHNVAIEQARDDPVIMGRIAEYTGEIEKAFATALERARERGELNPAIDPARGARHLVTMKLGIGDQARMGASLADMIDILDAGLALLGNGAARAPMRPGLGGELRASSAAGLSRKAIGTV